MDERRQLISIVLAEVRADERGLSWFRPQPKYEAYMEAVVPVGGLPVASEEPSERKTGLYVPNVETTRLVRDERGWLRLAG